MTVWTSNCGMMELRLGDYREVLADVEADHCITDPPYSERTHGGHRKGQEQASRARMRVDRRTGAVYSCGAVKRRDIGYGGWSKEDVAAFGEWCGSRVAGWVCAATDHNLVRHYEAALGATGRYVFAPLPWVEPGRTVRLSGDGPSSWAVQLVVARPRTREMQRWGTLPGAYIVTGGMRKGRHMGGKDIGTTRAIVRDYSRPGDLIVDPCAGGGTTLLAAAIEGRRAIGAEIDPVTYHKTVERLSRPYTPVVRFEALTGTQGEML